MERKARSICPNDQIVLQRYGRYHSNKNQYLEAIKIYDESIRLIPDIYINWFSYASRRDAYYYYSKKLIKQNSDEDEIDKYLKCAYEDGKLCLQSKCTEQCMMKMAQICFERAMPDNELGISFRCKHKDFVYKALENIHETLNKRDITKDGRIYNDLGRYYPYIGEYRKAIESLKTALELNKWSENYPTFSDLCKCFVAFYEKGNDKNLLIEFRFMLKEAKKRGCDIWVEDAIDMICQHNSKMLIDLVQNMIEWDVRSCEMLIEEALNQIRQNLPESTSTCQNLRRKFERELQETSDQDSDINGPTEIQKSQSTENFKYDFFVSHSEKGKDKDWVNCMMLPQLEEFDDEIKFKGFIPSHDFVPGDIKMKSMLKGITQNCKLLIVLTPDYLKDNSEKYFSDVMIFSVIKSKVKEKTIIPIMLEYCEVPPNLQLFTLINFAEKSDWERLRMSLTVNIDSETRLEERMSTLTTCDIDED